MNNAMSPIKRGKRKKRSELKALLMLIILKLEGPIGRYRLKEMLDLSEQEGLVRLMLTDLKQENLIKTSKAGCELTTKGEEFLGRFLKKYRIVDIKEMNLESLRIGPKNVILQIHGSPMPESIAGLRDAAVRAGASGAVLVTYEQGVLKIPTVYSSLENEHPRLAVDLRKTLNLFDGDVLIACFSKDKWRALEGGLSATMFLVKGSYP